MLRASAEIEILIERLKQNILEPRDVEDTLPEVLSDEDKEAVTKESLKMLEDKNLL